jgi:hypothetical protein
MCTYLEPSQVLPASSRTNFGNVDFCESAFWRSEAVGAGLHVSSLSEERCPAANVADATAAQVKASLIADKVYSLKKTVGYV